MNVRLLIVALTISLGLSGPAAARNPAFKAGMHHYMRGEFKEAVAQFQKALNGPISRDEKVNAHKFIGMSLFPLGRMADAEKNFVKCLTLDHECAIHRDEALDESVIPFFRQVKERLEHPTPTPRVSDSVPTSSMPPVAAAATPSPAPPAAPAGSPKQSTGTRIIILSNVKEAQVLIDGILAGPTGTPLSAPAGTVDIEVVAKGHVSRKSKLSVVKSSLNTYQIDLQAEGPSREEPVAAKANPKADTLAGEPKEQGKASVRSRDEEPRREDTRRQPPVLPREDQDRPKGTESDTLFGEEERSRREPRRGRERDRGEDVASFRAPDPATPASGKTPFSIMHILPFGIGQLYNGDYLLGAAVAGIQLYSIYAIYDAQDRMERATNSLTSAYRRSDLSAEQQAAYAQQINSYVSRQREDQNRYAILLASSYVFGAAQAIIMRPDLPAGKSVAFLSWDWREDGSPVGGLRLVMDWNF